MFMILHIWLGCLIPYTQFLYRNVFHDNYIQNIKILYCIYLHILQIFFYQYIFYTLIIIDITTLTPYLTLLAH